MFIMKLHYFIIYCSVSYSPIFSGYKTVIIILFVKYVQKLCLKGSVFGSLVIVSISSVILFVVFSLNLLCFCVLASPSLENLPRI